MIQQKIFLMSRLLQKTSGYFFEARTSAICGYLFECTWSVFREKQSITLMEALRKMTIMPAKRLESISPAMRFKGRLQVGSDADFTIFDPGAIIDKSTFEKGLSFSKGIQYVLVNGSLVIKNGHTVPDIYPGQSIYGKLNVSPN